jgi:hypothetical protein
MEKLNDGRIHHKTIAVRFNNVKTPEEGAKKIDIAMNDFLDKLQEKYPNKRVRIFQRNDIERRFTENGISYPCSLITFFFELI